MRFERHDPVDRKEGHREAVKHQSRAAHASQTRRKRRVAGAILLVRPAVQFPDESPPHREIDHIANQEKRQVKVGLFEFERGVGSNEIRMRPRIHPAEPEKKRKSQSGKQGQRARRCFEQPANRQSPESAGQVMHHQKGRATQRKT